MSQRQAAIIQFILAVILPPVGVFTREGLGLHLILNIVLTLIGYIPGIIHAVYVLMRNR